MLHPLVPPKAPPRGFYNDFKSRFGRRWHEAIQEFEKMHEQLGYARSHVDFLRKCLELGVSPVFVRDKFEPWTRSELKHQRLIERQRLKNRKIFWTSRCFNLERDIADFMTNFDRNLCDLWKNSVLGLASFRLQKSFITNQKSHEKKLNNLLVNAGLIFYNNNPKRPGTKNCDIFVKNLSSTPLTEAEKSILALGGNFGISPTQLPVLKLLAPIITATDFLRQKDPETAAEFQSEAVRILRNARLPSPNLPTAQIHALRELKNDKSRVFLPADKGSVTVVMDKEDYDRLENDLLSDETTYRLLNTDLTTEISTNLVAKFREIGSKKIRKLEYNKFYQSTGSVPLFYGLPKIHKDPVRLRPITSCVDSVDESLAKYLTSILQPLCQQPLRNSSEFVKKIKHFNLTPTDRLVSFDVVSLFTNIPLDYTCDVIHGRLLSDSTLEMRSSLSADQIVDLLKFSLKNSVFRSGTGQHFLQLEGTAMGKSFSPVVAEIILQHLENLLFRSDTPLPRFWTRYVDDVLAVWEHGEEKIPEFLEILNNLVPGINFTAEFEKDGAISFLDVLVQRTKNNFQTSVYRKATHSGRYLNNASCHLPSQKSSAISSVAHRARQICSSQKLLDEEFAHIRDDFRKNGFSDLEINCALFPKPRPPCPVNNRNSERKRIFTLPFCGASSHKLKRLFRKNGIQAAFRPNETLRSALTKVKSNREPAETKNCVYCLTCSCGDIYIGESKRRAEVRWEEHRREWSNKDPVKSAFNGHFNHMPEFSGSILTKEKNWYLRRAKEALLIRKAKLQGLKPLLNSNSGHQIDSIFNGLVEKMPNLKL